MNPKLLAALQHPALTAIQSAVLPVMEAGRDLVALAPTGSGKTAAYLLPVLDRLAAAPGEVELPSPRPGGAPRALVLAPTRELAEQIATVAQALGGALGVRVAALVGGVPEAPQLAALAAGAELLVATPGRLLDLASRREVFLGAIGTLVLDEADVLLDAGFAPDTLRLVSLLPAHHTALFSATFPDPSAADGLLVDPVMVDLTAEAPALERIDQHVLFVRKSDKHQLLAHVLGGLPRALVFARTRAGVDRAVELLATRGIPASGLHGDRSQAVRRATLEAFHAGATRFLIATDVAARGLHVAGLQHVVNLDLPEDPETWLHRVGRVGRAGAFGVALSFCDPTEHPYLRAIETLTGRPLQPRVDHPFHDWDLLPPARNSRHRPPRGRRR